MGLGLGLGLVARRNGKKQQRTKWYILPEPGTEVENTLEVCKVEFEGFLAEGSGLI